MLSTVYKPEMTKKECKTSNSETKINELKCCISMEFHVSDVCNQLSTNANALFSVEFADDFLKKNSTFRSHLFACHRHDFVWQQNSSNRASNPVNSEPILHQSRCLVVSEISFMKQIVHAAVSQPIADSHAPPSKVKVRSRLSAVHNHFTSPQPT